MKRIDAIRILHNGGLELPTGYKFDREDANARGLTAAARNANKTTDAKQDESLAVTSNRTHP